jgi:hypothetical protein
MSYIVSPPSLLKYSSAEWHKSNEKQTFFRDEKVVYNSKHKLIPIMIELLNTKLNEKRFDIVALIIEAELLSNSTQKLTNPDSPGWSIL